MKTIVDAQNVRQSNMELLRIVAMFMILVYHTVYYVFYDYRGENPIFASLMTLLHIGVPLFVLISGYFGIKPSIKGLLNLYLVLLFYNLFFYGIRVIYGDVCFSYGEFIRLWFPFSIYQSYWFFKVYLMLYLFAPVINYFRDKSWQKRSDKLLIISGFVTFYWGWFAQHPSLFDGKNVVNFIFLYMLGNWLRTRIVERTGDLKKARTRYLISYLVVAICIGVLLYFSNAVMQDHLKRLCYGYNSPVLILMSVLFFLIFTTFTFKNKLVNWVAGSVFAVYCVHENRYFFREAWYGFIENQYMSQTRLTCAFTILSVCCLLFILAILLDKVRMFLVRPTMPILDWAQDKVRLLCCKINKSINKL